MNKKIKATACSFHSKLVEFEWFFCVSGAIAMLSCFKDIFHSDPKNVNVLWERLYKKLNVHKDGRVDVQDLREELEQIGKV